MARKAAQMTPTEAAREEKPRLPNDHHDMEVLERLDACPGSIRVRMLHPFGMHRAAHNAM
jgi:hypothetical protein